MRTSVGTVASYVRVSTEDQKREGYSLGNQLEANEAFIKQRFGKDAEILKYSDVESGHSVLRKDYLRLVEDCEHGKIDAVVVWRLDRFMRNTAAGLEVLSDLNKRGILIYSVLEGEVNFNDPTSKFVTGMHLLNAENERDRIIYRVMPGMKKGASLGHYQGTRYPALGIFYDKKEAKLVWVENEVKLLKIHRR